MSAVTARTGLASLLMSPRGRFPTDVETESPVSEDSVDSDGGRDFRTSANPERRDRCRRARSAMPVSVGMGKCPTAAWDRNRVCPHPLRRHPSKRRTPGTVADGPGCRAPIHAGAVHRTPPRHGGDGDRAFRRRPGRGQAVAGADEGAPQRQRAYGSESALRHWIADRALQLREAPCPPDGGRAARPAGFRPNPPRPRRSDLKSTPMRP